MVASISASLNAPWLWDLVSGPATRDNPQASRQRMTQAFFMPIECVRPARIRRENVRALGDLPSFGPGLQWGGRTRPVPAFAAARVRRGLSPGLGQIGVLGARYWRAGAGRRRPAQSLRLAARGTAPLEVTRLTLQHPRRDFALRQPDIDLRFRGSVARLLDDHAVLVGNDGITALQDFERAELGKMSDQWIQTSVCTRQAKVNQLSGGRVRGLQPAPRSGDAQTQVQAAKPGRQLVQTLASQRSGGLDASAHAVIQLIHALLQPAHVAMQDRRCALHTA